MSLMEDKQLDFDQPILSVRRIPSKVTKEKDEKRKSKNSFPSIPPLPAYKSELKSGPMRNPGAVPFLWERTPGQPKTESKPEKPPIAPKLPPGRIVKVNQQTLNKISEDPSVIENQARKAPSSQSIDKDENVMKFESFKDAVEEKESSDSGDGDEEYLDAVDTLSRTESFFINCSLSAVSGLDGPDTKPFGTFSADTQTRDFMMGRFLPAAKAMASETPQYVSWKQPVAREQPRQVKKVAEGDKQTPLLPHRSIIVPRYVKDNEEEDSDDEDDDDDFDESRNLSGKVCGLLPRFCLKSSFCLLNPVPCMSVRTRVPMSPSSKTRTRSSSAGSCSGSENEQFGVASFEKRSIGGPHTTERCEDMSITKNESNRGVHQRNSRNLEGSSLYRRLQGSGVSPYQNELPQHPFNEEKRYIHIPEEAKKDGGANDVNSFKKGPTSFRELLACQNTEEEISLSSPPMVEKTLYIDSVHKVDPSNLNLSYSDTNGTPSTGENALEINEKIRGIDETPLVDSVKDIEKSPFSDKPDKEVGMGILKGFGQGQDLYHESFISPNPKLHDNENIYFEDQKFQKAENVEYSSYLELPPPPPLPKSPSESWLWRTLPSLSSKNLSSRSYLGTGINPQNQNSKTAYVDPKWQTIVKTTTGQHQSLRFSEELMTPIPETS